MELSKSSGVTPTGISQETIKSFFLLVPPIDDQIFISNYLDHKTQQIDSLIEKTEQKIELLKEQRTSLIHQMITKGLNPDVEMKDSGVEWIGKIPSGWKVGKLYQYGELLSGSTPSRSVPEFWKTGEDLIG